MNKQMKTYIAFWLTQAISNMGSSITSFALTLWLYTVNHSAMQLSLMMFCRYMPYVISGPYVGSFVDRHNKKHIMLACDLAAAVCSVSTLFLYLTDSLAVWMICVINLIIGFMNAFQSPAAAVAVGRLVPQDEIARVSGMQSFSQNLTIMLVPMIASSLFAFGGLGAVLAVDLTSFAAAFLVLLIFVQIPEGEGEHKGKERHSFKEGLAFLKTKPLLMTAILTMSLINFISRITYENTLSPMLLARSGDNAMVVGVVNAVIGAAGVLGGLYVSAFKLKKSPLWLLCIPTLLSFLLGDLIMGLGRNVFWWSIAGFSAQFFVPMIIAGENMIMYKEVPDSMRGRIFAVQNTVQYGTIPFGILLGGFLADYVFEPFMAGGSDLAIALSHLVGTGAGSGMAVMFLCTAILGSTHCLIAYLKNKKYE